MGQTLRPPTWWTVKFGSALAMSASGHILAAGAPGNAATDYAGEVHVFRYNTGTRQWEALGQVLEGAAREDRFGWSVALSADGTVLAAGDLQRGDIFDNGGTPAGYVQVFALTEL